MIVVADTSPLNYLIRLGHIDVLRQLYGRILIPHAVHDELPRQKAPPAVRARVARSYLPHKGCPDHYSLIVIIGKSAHSPQPSGWPIHAALLSFAA